MSTVHLAGAPNTTTGVQACTRCGAELVNYFGEVEGDGSDGFYFLPEGDVTEDGTKLSEGAAAGADECLA